MNQVIIFKNNNKLALMIPTDEALQIMSIDDIAKKDIPNEADYKIINRSDLPVEWCFFDAWIYSDPITIDLERAKTITYDKMYLASQKEFKPFDEIIALQIPGQNAQAAEAQRVLIRQKYDVIQKNINACTDIESLKTIYDSLGD